MSKDEKHDKPTYKGDKGSDLVPVAWAILVMGISISLVIITYVWFGHLGSTYSSRLLEQQQKALREKYGLPPEVTTTNATLLQMPPSLRNLSSNSSI
ncbi:MAG TPA: hypothetical protein VE130_08600 [Nitrososphaeraceae archaeon]|nr:hypothetical protein [Nitrososphaeraceae archaeon]